jgi:hypothetical protein
MMDSISRRQNQLLNAQLLALQNGDKDIDINEIAKLKLLRQR